MHNHKKTADAELIKSTATIIFRCPNCKNLCAFKSIYAGKTARCIKCNKHFIIPSESGGYAELVSTAPVCPKPGFYSAAIKQNLRTFISPDSITALVFIGAAASLDFFVGATDYSFDLPGFRIQLPTGWIATIVSWSLIFWFCLEMINLAAGDSDKLPEMTLSFFQICRNSYFFVIALIFAILPFQILYQPIIMMGLDVNWLAATFVFAGLMLLPMTLLAVSSTEKIWHVFRYDFHIASICKAPKPYLFTAALVAGGFLVQFGWAIYIKANGFEKLLAEKGVFITALLLLISIIITFLNLFTLRIIGLFARHYACYLPQIYED